MNTCTNCGDDHDFKAPAGEYAGLCYTCALGAACTDAARAVLDDRFVQDAATRCADAVANLIEAWRTAGVEISNDREEMERYDAQVMALGAARMLGGNRLEKCSDCGALLRDCGPRCAVCDDTSTDDSE
jgi:hypothetical protein